ncbi:MAG: response regulator [Planctomycetota bacterium]
MVVEDEVASRVALNHLLGRLGVKVTQVGDAEAAARLVRSTPVAARPQAVLVDYNLPGADGLSFLQWLESFDAAVRLALVTAQDRAALHDLPESVAFFRKPASFDRIVSFLALTLSDPSKQTTTRGV